MRLFLKKRRTLEKSAVTFTRVILKIFYKVFIYLIKVGVKTSSKGDDHEKIIVTESVHA